MGIFGRIDPEDGVREGWVLDDNNEFGVDGYNVFLAVTTSDGTSGVRAINSAGAVTFFAKSDGDGYVGKDLDVTNKITAKGLKVTSGSTLGYVLTSDSEGNATWQPPDIGDVILDGYVREKTFQENKQQQSEINKTILDNLDGYLTPQNHRDLDQLVHGIAEDSHEIITYDSSNKVINITVWTDVGQTTKIREQQFSYNGVFVSQIVSMQYDVSGSIAETLTETLTYNGAKLVNISRVLT